MSTEGATALLERMTSDEDFRKKIEAASTPEEKRRVVTEAGYEVRPDDIPTIRSLGGVSELSDDDLEKVAGGIDTNMLIAGGVTVGIAAAAAAAV